MRRVCRLSPAADRGRWSPADVVAGIVGKSTIKRFGQKGHTAFSNVINFVANLIWAVDTGERGTIASQVVMSLAHRKRDGLESMIYKLGTSKWAAGARARARGKGGGGGSGEEDGEEVEAWGRGEVSGMLANFKSATWICAPQIYGLSYTVGTGGARSFYGAPMLVAAATAVLSQLCVVALPSMRRFEEECAGPA